MKICGYCGKESEDSAHFCAGCGTQEFKEDTLNLNSASAPPSGSGLDSYRPSPPSRIPPTPIARLAAMLPNWIPLGALFLPLVVVFCMLLFNKAPSATEFGERLVTSTIILAGGVFLAWVLMSGSRARIHGPLQIWFAFAALLCPAAALIYALRLGENGFASVICFAIGILGAWAISCIAIFIPGPHTARLRNALQLACASVGWLSPVVAVVFLFHWNKAHAAHDVSVVVLYAFTLGVGLLVGLVSSGIAAVLRGRHKAYGYSALGFSGLIFLLLVIAYLGRMAP